jgi:hypothetical protein
VPVVPCVAMVVPAVVAAPMMMAVPVPVMAVVVMPPAGAMTMMVGAVSLCRAARKSERAKGESRSGKGCPEVHDAVPV